MEVLANDSTRVGTPVLMPLAAVEAKTGLRKTTIYALMKKDDVDRFPSPIKVLKRKVLWTSDSVDEWISARIRDSLRAERKRGAA